MFEAAGFDGITLDLWGVPYGLLKVWIEALISGEYLVYSDIFRPEFVKYNLAETIRELS